MEEYLTKKPVCSGLILTDDGTVYDHDPATCRCHGAWIEQSVMKGGWANIDKYSLSAPTQLCEMCRKEHVAHVHVMRHPLTGEIKHCGCICSGHMQIGFEDMTAEQALGAAVAREKELKSDDTKIATKRRRLAAERAAFEEEVSVFEKRQTLLETEVAERVEKLYAPLERKIARQQLSLDKREEEIENARKVLTEQCEAHIIQVREQDARNQLLVAKQLQDARAKVLARCRFRSTASGWMITHGSRTFFMAIKRDEYRLVPVYNGNFDNSNERYFGADGYDDAKDKAVELIDAWVNRAA